MTNNTPKPAPAAVPSEQEIKAAVEALFRNASVAQPGTANAQKVASTQGKQ